MKHESYDAYILSEEWQKFRKRYFGSGMPRLCLACGSSRRITLHHMTYSRLGREMLTDVCPLCRTCHERLHAAETTAGRGGATAFQIQLSSVFGIGKETAKQIMSPWLNRAGGGRKLSRKQRSEIKKREKLLREATMNRALHERMCR